MPRETGAQGPLPVFQDPATRPKLTANQKLRTDQCVVRGEKELAGSIPLLEKPSSPTG